MKPRFKEVETKYNAAEIGFKDFINYCESLNPKYVRKLRTSGYDHFYADPKDSDTFCRHRVGEDWNELSYKKKLADFDNFVRDEVNIKLGKGVGQDEVKAFLSAMGYSYNTSIFKNALIYEFDKVILVYYVIYTEDLIEIGRFMEIEAREDYPWPSVQAAWDVVTVVEKVAEKELGISYRKRIKKSLWEMVQK